MPEGFELSENTEAGLNAFVCYERSDLQTKDM